MSYTYHATGQKLRKVSSTMGTTDYVAGIQYKNDGTIDFIQAAEGVARRNGAHYVHEYNLTDHLGNVRYTFNKNPTTREVQMLQADDYYAFGKDLEVVAAIKIGRKMKGLLMERSISLRTKMHLSDRFIEKVMTRDGFS